MSNFEKFLLERGIPITEIATPLERLLLRIGAISHPIGIFSYPRRAIWFSLSFVIFFLGTAELLLQTLFGISIFISVPPQTLLISICILLLFGPLAALSSSKAMIKHRSVLQAFLSKKALDK